MGDLKKKKNDYIVKANSNEELVVEQEQILNDEQTIARLGAYIQKFYDKQIEKMKEENNDGEE